MPRANDKHDDPGNDNFAARGNHDLFPQSPVGKIHEFFLLDNMKRRENPERLERRIRVGLQLTPVSR
jgi:hypothetical protein